MRTESTCASLALRYIRLSRAWYAPYQLPMDYVDEILIGSEDNEPGPASLVLRWYSLTPNKRWCPRLELFSDSWAWITRWPAFFEWLASRHDTDISPDEVEYQLHTWSIRDGTPVTPPGAT